MLIPFAPPSGLNSDDTTFAAEGRWADGNNVRFHFDRAQTIGGWDRPPKSGGGDADAFSGTAFAGIALSGGIFTQAIIIATTEGLYRYYDGTGSGTYNAVNTLLSLSASASNDTWQLDLFGTTLIANRAVSANNIYAATLNAGNGQHNAPAVIATAPENIKYMIVTPERQVLAFGCEDASAGNLNGLMIRGSDIEDYTDWTPSSTNNAFEHILPGPGYLLSAGMVGPYVAAWTNLSLHMGQFIGDPAQTYRFDKVADNCGIIAPNARQIVDGIAYWVVPDGRWMRWAPGGIPEVIPCPILKDYQDNRDTDALPVDRSFMTYNPKFRELWFFYSDNRDTHNDLPSRYIAYSLSEGTWFRGQMVRTTGFLGIRGDLIMTDANSIFYHHETGKTANGAAMDWHIQSADNYFDESQTRVMIRGVRPDFEDQDDDVSLTLFMRDYPQGTAVTKGPYVLSEGADKKDFRASGKIAAIKLSGGDSDGSYMRLGKLLFDVVTLGER